MGGIFPTMGIISPGRNSVVHFPPSSKSPLQPKAGRMGIMSGTMSAARHGPMSGTMSGTISTPYIHNYGSLE